MDIERANLQLNSKFYYAFNKKNALSVKEGALIIKTNKNGRIKIINNRFKELINYKSLSENIFETQVNSENEIQALKTELDMDDDIISYGLVYIGDNKMDMGTTDEVLVDFSPGVTIQQQNSLFEKFKVKLVKTTKTYKMVLVSKGENTETVN